MKSVKTHKLLLFSYVLLLMVCLSLQTWKQSSLLHEGTEHEIDISGRASTPKDHHWRPLNIYHQHIYCLWKRIGCWFPHVSELSPHMHAGGFDRHRVHQRDFWDCLPLIFSHDSRLPIIQQGFGPREQTGKGGMLTRALMYPGDAHFSNSDLILQIIVTRGWGGYKCLGWKCWKSVREIWNMSGEDIENDCKSYQIIFFILSMRFPQICKFLVKMLNNAPVLCNLWLVFTWGDMPLIFHKVQMTCGLFYQQPCHVISHDFTPAVTWHDGFYHKMSMRSSVADNLLIFFIVKSIIFFTYSNSIIVFYC